MVPIPVTKRRKSYIGICLPFELINFELELILPIGDYKSQRQILGHSMRRLNLVPKIEKPKSTGRVQLLVLVPSRPKPRFVNSWEPVLLIG